MSASGPRTIGNFAIERELGAGGMGVVLLGRHASLERLAVLKRLRPELAASEELVERFAREARAAAAVHHQNVVAVYDWISWRGEHYIAQEYVDGVDLRAALHELGSVPWRVAALVGLELARGLEAIHARGTVHRDLKPANVLLGRNGDVKIADFGIAHRRHAATGSRGPGRRSARRPTSLPSSCWASAWTRAGICSRWASCSTSCWRARRPSASRSKTRRTRCSSASSARATHACARRRRSRRAGSRALVRSLLRAKPRSRPGSAQLVRRLLERRLGAFPTDAKLELASFLWEEGVFQPREGDTVVLSTPAPVGALARRLRHAALAAGLAGALALAAHEHRELAQLPALVRQAYVAFSRSPGLDAAKLPFSAAAPAAPEAASRP